MEGGNAGEFLGMEGSLEIGRGSVCLGAGKGDDRQTDFDTGCVAGDGPDFFGPG